MCTRQLHKGGFHTYCNVERVEREGYVIGGDEGCTCTGANVKALYCGSRGSAVIRNGKLCVSVMLELCTTRSFCVLIDAYRTRVVRG